MMTDDHTNAQTNPQTPRQNPVLSRLSAFVGEWQWEASLGGQSMGRGRTLFEWLEGGAFLAEHSDAEQPEFPSGSSIIGGDDTTETYCMLYFDSRSVSRIYQMSLSDGVWKLWREAPGFWQRFEGTFSDDGTSIKARWEKSTDGSQWELDFDLTYTKLRGK
jgi:hypothetical protein